MSYKNEIRQIIDGIQDEGQLLFIFMFLKKYFNYLNQK